MKAQKTPAQCLEGFKQHNVEELLKQRPFIGNVLAVIQATMVLLDEDTSSEHARKVMGNPRFWFRINDFQTGNVDATKLMKIRKYTQNKQFDPAQVVMSSVGACYLCEWILAIQRQNKTPAQNERQTTNGDNGNQTPKATSNRVNLAKAGLQSLFKPYEAPKRAPAHKRNATIGAARTQGIFNQRPLAKIDEEPENQVLPVFDKNIGNSNLLMVPKKKFGTSVVSAFMDEVGVNDDNETNDFLFSNKKADFQTMGQGINGLFLTEKFSSNIAKYQLRPEHTTNKMKKMISKNHHKNFVNMDVVYEKKRAKLAKELREKEARIKREAQRKKIEKEKLDQFVNDVGHKGERLTMIELKQLNSVYKKEYAKVLLHENDDVQALLKHTGQKVETNHDINNNLMMDIEDVHDEWEKAENDINLALARKAEELGITQKLYNKRVVKEFNIMDSYKTIKSCRTCLRGLKCELHPLGTKQNIYKEDDDDNQLYSKKKKKEWYKPPTQAKTKWVPQARRM